jgi:hypothetical protein
MASHYMGSIIVQINGVAPLPHPQLDAASVNTLATPDGLAAPMLNTMRAPHASDGGNPASIRSNIIGGQPLVIRCLVTHHTSSVVAPQICWPSRPRPR